MTHVTFFTGTGTDVGKTYCAAAAAEMRCAAGAAVGVYKPVASGCDRDAHGQAVPADAVILWNAAGRPRTLADVCPQRFWAPLSPPMAAAAENRHIDVDGLTGGLRGWLDGTYDEVIVEGAGGLFSPIANSWLNVDLIAEIRRFVPDLSVILVAPNRLGVQHDVLATVTAAAARHCRIDAVWLNTFAANRESETIHRTDSTDGSPVDPSVAGNPVELRKWTNLLIYDSAADFASNRR